MKSYAVRVTSITGCALLFLSLQLSAQKKADKLPLTLEAIWGGYFDEQQLVVHPMNTQEKIAFIYSDKNSSNELILALDFTTGRLVDTLFTNQVIPKGDSVPVTFTFFEDFELSPNDSLVLVKTQAQPLFRISGKEACYVWNRNKKVLRAVTVDGKVSYASFSPDSKKLAYILNNNLYVKDMETEAVLAVTSDGSMDNITYGCANALYENGFGLRKMYSWSEDGQSIVFTRINEQPVKNYPITYYDKNYPDVYGQRYPKAGEAIPQVEVFLYNLPFKLLTKLDVGVNPNQYITGVNWSPDGKSVLIQRLNRPQNFLEILQANIKNGNTKTIYSETKPDYIKLFPDNLFCIKSRNSFLWQTEKNGWSHIYEFSMDSLKMKQVTTGEWEVQKIKGADEENGFVYYMSNEPSPRGSSLYRIKYDGTQKRRLTDKNGWHEVLLANTKRYFIDIYSNQDNPTIYQMYSTREQKLYQPLIENKELKNRLNQYKIPGVDFFSFKSSDDKLMYGYFIHPMNAEGAKHPLLIYNGGSPELQGVTDRWNDKILMSLKYLASQGYYVACLDTRGTPGKGEAYRKANYKKIGDAELDDLMEAKKFIIRSMNANVDTSKVAVMGWSYGGYISTLAATKYAPSFAATVAIAPVTNWRLYENIFAERYMTMPSENPDGYMNNAPVNFVNNYKGGLLLVHGTADDNVHLQNSMVLSRELVNANKQFDQYYLTDRGHLLNDNVNNITRLNLFIKIRNFLNNQFGVGK
ncbi:MAG: hypothetical protein EKK37_07635 [Sphingobacteriales bacterium]|nr:MAG: hypothetical protein EKK37_07635 [Sphingobacteriales bacterium]